ncbi:glycosyltransferase [Sutcliffiella horikoshii]|uniref:glycosyltransferase n=1 Tax=Sutcliffiella horikoshii TaxID=79883 RepID=UPI003CF8F871
MNILYISNLRGNKWTGPNQSVPRQIRAQSKYDNVFWYNINNTVNDEWDEIIKYHSTNDFPKISLNSLPTPFNRPDLIVFQGLYAFPFCKVIYEAWKENIPYVIVPRGALPQSAQRNKRFKKTLANFIFFNHFVKRAKAIHYLTEQEYRDSGDRWNSTHFIIPNGIEIPNHHRGRREKPVMKGVYIGRMDIYQKGLDWLLEVCIDLKSDFISNNVTIDLYGPDMDGARNKLCTIIEENDLSKIVTLRDGVFDKEKEKVLLESDFFILTSRFEGHPMGLIEALSYGIPCIVTEGTNMAKEIKENESGWIATNDVTSVKQAFTDMLLDKLRFNEISANAFNLAKSYNWDYIAKLTTDKYSELLHGVK